MSHIVRDDRSPLPLSEDPKEPAVAAGESYPPLSAPTKLASAAPLHSPSEMHDGSVAGTDGAFTDAKQSTYTNEDTPADAYVTKLLTQLRVMIHDMHAEQMALYITNHFEHLVEWVEKYKLHDDSRFAPFKDQKGSDMRKKMFLKAGHDEPPIKLFELHKYQKNPVTGNYFIPDGSEYGKGGTYGDGQCWHRTVSKNYFGVEDYWEHIRLVTLAYAEIENPMLTLYGEEKSYQQHFVNDVKEQTPDYTQVDEIDITPIMRSKLMGRDVKTQAGNLEGALVSFFFNENIVFWTQMRSPSHDYTQLPMNPICVYNSGVMQDGHTKNDGWIPSIDGSFWVINSPGGTKDLYHWEPVFPEYYFKEEGNANKKQLTENRQKYFEDAYSRLWDERITIAETRSPDSGKPGSLGAPTKETPPKATPATAKDIFMTKGGKSKGSGKDKKGPDGSVASPPSANLPATIDTAAAKPSDTHPAPKTAPVFRIVPRPGQEHTMPGSKPAGYFSGKGKDSAPKGRVFDEIYADVLGFKGKDDGLGKSMWAEENDKADAQAKWAQLESERKDKLAYIAKEEKRIAQLKNQLRQDTLRLEFKTKNRPLTSAASPAIVADSSPDGFVSKESVADVSKELESPEEVDLFGDGETDEFGEEYEIEAEYDDWTGFDGWVGPSGYDWYDVAQEAEFQDYGTIAGCTPQQWEKHWQESNDAASQPDLGGRQSSISDMATPKAAMQTASPGPGEKKSSAGASGSGGEPPPDKGTPESGGDKPPTKGTSSPGGDKPPDKDASGSGGEPPDDLMKNVLLRILEREDKKAQKEERKKARKKKRRENPGGDPSSDPPDGENDEKDTQASDTDDDDDKALYDSRYKITFKQHLKDFGKNFAIDKLDKLDTFKEMHLLEILETMPLTKDMIKQMWEDAWAQHKNTVTYADRQAALLQFQAPHPSTRKKEQAWRMKYMAALLDALPHWVRGSFFKLCRNNGKWQAATSADEPDVESLAAGSNNSMVSRNDFISSDVKGADIMESEFFDPVAIIWILLCSCFSGRDWEHTLIQESIAKPIKSTERYPAIKYTQYVYQYERLKKLFYMSAKFEIDAPLPASIFKMYEEKLLGKDYEYGVLEEFPDLTFEWQSFKMNNRLAFIKKGELTRIQESISNFHQQVLSHIEHDTPKKPLKVDNKQHVPDVRSFEEKKGKKGKGGKKGKDDKKGKGGGKGKKGKGKGPSVDPKNLNPEQKTWYHTKLADGYMRCLCDGFILNFNRNTPQMKVVCPHEANGGTCFYGQMGGHPKNKNITADMQEKMKKRAEAREAFKQGKAAKKAKAKGKGKDDGGKGGQQPTGTYYQNVVQKWGWAPKQEPAQNAAAQQAAQQAAHYWYAAQYGQQPATWQQYPALPPPAPYPVIRREATGPPRLDPTYTPAEYHRDKVVSQDSSVPEQVRNAAEARMRNFLDAGGQPL